VEECVAHPFAGVPGARSVVRHDLACEGRELLGGLAAGLSSSHSAICTWQAGGLSCSRGREHVSGLVVFSWLAWL
jgi:hypothetical protein